MSIENSFVVNVTQSGEDGAKSEVVVGTLEATASDDRLLELVAGGVTIRFSASALQGQFNRINIAKHQAKQDAAAKPKK